MLDKPFVNAYLMFGRLHKMLRFFPQSYFDLAIDAVNAYVAGDLDWFRECIEEMRRCESV